MKPTAWAYCQGWLSDTKDTEKHQKKASGQREQPAHHQHHGVPQKLSPKSATWLWVSLLLPTEVGPTSSPSTFIACPKLPVSPLDLPMGFRCPLRNTCPLRAPKPLFTLAVPSQASSEPLPHPLVRTRCDHQPSTLGGLTSTFPLPFPGGRGDCTPGPRSSCHCT